jgi:4-aminobutyrate aminotransferase-like enzyme/Ser/Thr protein kinase RdoA (MazF antagonist)
MVEDRLIRPQLTSEEALHLTATRFGLRVDVAQPLPSERDQNFLLEDKSSGRRFVLKLAHAGEKRSSIDLQNRMLEHLARAGFPLSTVLHSSDGEEVVEVEGPEGAQFFSRLLSWLPGDILNSVRPKTPALFRSLGSFLGSMDLALADLEHPAQDRPLKWDLRHASRVIRTHLLFVEDPEQLTLLEGLTDRLLDRLKPLAPQLRQSVIHGDANDHNVLVSPLDGEGDEGRRVIGLVDFGDSTRSYTCAEAAIAGAYAMLGQSDPLAAASEVVRGYHRAFPLLEAEIAALFPLMGLRLCASVAIAAHHKRREPENDYLRVSEAPAWDLLDWMSSESLDLPHFLFRQACDMEPVPISSAVVDWLRAAGSGAAPVVGLDLRTIPLHVFDLSIESGEFGVSPDPEDPEAWTDAIFGRMEATGAKVGVGRYDEARRWYTPAAFRGQGWHAPEWRTLHIGIDLMVEAGSAIYAPFEAVVHSVANNEGSLDYGPTVILEHRVRVPADHGPAQVPDRASEQGGPDAPLVFHTLYGHLADDVLSTLTPGQEIAKGEAFAHVGSFPTNGNWVPHLHLQVITDLLGMEGTFPGVCRPSQREVWKALSPDPNLILGIPDGEDGRETSRPGRPSGAPVVPRRGRSTEQLVEARRDLLGPTLSIAYARPLKIVRGLGQFLYDDEGQPHLDCVNNVPHVGHGNPRVVKAGQRQMAVLNTNTRYLHDLIVEYAERLLSTLPDSLSVVYFVCSGSEANELALRMARAHTRRDDVIVVDGAYHGNTSAMVDLSPYKFDGPGGEGSRVWVRTTPMPDPYRGLFRDRTGLGSFATGAEGGRGTPGSRRGRAKGPGPGGDPTGADSPQYLEPDQLGQRYGDLVRQAIADMQAQETPPAAFFCESLLGCGGQIVLPDGYLAAAFQHVREAGGVCVADEVQVGFGRVGSHFWGFETQGVVPDILTLGKPMGNGHPLAAVVTTREIAASFTTGMEYFNTYGGNPVSCAIGLAVLDVIEEEGLQENARIVGGRILEGFSELQERHEILGDVRGLGLYIGVELVEDRESRAPATAEANRLKERLRDHRILVSTDGPDENVLKIKPPLVFTLKDADLLVSTADRILEEDGF